MEVSTDLKQLYKHWGFHTRESKNDTPKIEYDKKLFQQIQNFITERMLIYEKKTNGIVPPWTKDKILNDYRFCNIYRELDKQTIQIHTLLKHLESDFELWLLNVAFCRMVCNPETIKKVGFLNYDSKNNRKVYDKLLKLQSPKYGVAYIFPISTVSKVGLKTREEFFCFYLPKIIKKCADAIKKCKKESVVISLEKILPIFGLNFKFHWSEILIDVAYQYPQYIDLFKKFPIGPGSIPTMKKLNADVEPADMNLFLTTITLSKFPYLTYDEKPVFLSAENWEGIGCEFRKYTNLIAGIGRRRKYNPIFKKVI